MLSDTRIAAMLRSCAAAAGMSESYVARLASGSGDTLTRLDGGMSLTARRAGRIVQWLSDHWPLDAEWPADIPRPAPSPDSPAARETAPPAANGVGETAVETVAACRAQLDALSMGDLAEAARIEARMFKAATALGGDGRIASPRALCAAMQVPRQVYDAVVRRYAGGGRPRPPHNGAPGTRVYRMWLLLVSSGDERFADPARCGLRLPLTGEAGMSEKIVIGAETRVDVDIPRPTGVLRVPDRETIRKAMLLERGKASGWARRRGFEPRFLHATLSAYAGRDVPLDSLKSAARRELLEKLCAFVGDGAASREIGKMMDAMGLPKSRPERGKTAHVRGFAS